MPKASRPKGKSNPPDPETPRRPTRATAGKGGRVSQLKKVAYAIEDPPRTTGKQSSNAALLDEPVNLVAPTPRTRTRKKKLNRTQKVTFLAT